MTAPRASCVLPGFAVGVALREEVAGLRYYAGQVQAVDSLGVRLTGVDWFVGTFTGYDFYFPWSNVLGITAIVTPEHDLHRWSEVAAGDQNRHRVANVDTPRPDVAPTPPLRWGEVGPG